MMQQAIYDAAGHAADEARREAEALEHAALEAEMEAEAMDQAVFDPTREAVDLEIEAETLDHGYEAVRQAAFDAELTEFEECFDPSVLDDATRFFAFEELDAEALEHVAFDAGRSAFEAGMEALEYGTFDRNNEGAVEVEQADPWEQAARYEAARELDSRWPSVHSRVHVSRRIR